MEDHRWKHEFGGSCFRQWDVYVNYDDWMIGSMNGTNNITIKQYLQTWVLKSQNSRLSLFSHTQSCGICPSLLRGAVLMFADIGFSIQTLTYFHFVVCRMFCSIIHFANLNFCFVEEACKSRRTLQDNLEYWTFYLRFYTVQVPLS